jgi:heat shock protein HslJ
MPLSQPKKILLDFAALAFALSLATAWAQDGNRYMQEFKPPSSHTLIVTESDGDQAGEATAADSAPTLEEVKNTTYYGLEGLDDAVTLQDGRWEGKPYRDRGTSRPKVNLVRDFIVCGDLDDDGRDETIVFLNLSTGGTGQLMYIAVVDRKDNKLHNVATKFIGDRVQIRGVRITQGTPYPNLLVDVVQVGLQDPACCPGEVTTRGWNLDPRGFLNPLIVSNKPERLSLETIAGTQWVLRAWDLEELAPEEPEVNISVQDGRFAGSSGCNRYFAPVKLGDMPGEVSVGPTGSTKMACPEQVMEVEDRFLRQLGSVKKFGFLVGQLALSYEKDGAWGTMLFDGRTVPQTFSP